MRGYSRSEHILQLVLVLHGGGPRGGLLALLLLLGRLVGGLLAKERHSHATGCSTKIYNSIIIGPRPTYTLSRTARLKCQRTTTRLWRGEARGRGRGSISEIRGPAPLTTALLSPRGRFRVRRARRSCVGAQNLLQT